jgi:hypothetical protein
MDEDKLSYVMKPRRGTIFMRTFLPWQIWRFASINLKMFGVIFASHKTHIPKSGAGHGRAPGIGPDPRLR